MAHQTATTIKTSATNFTAIPSPLSSRSSAPTTHSHRFSITITSSITTTISSHRWAASTMTSSRRHLDLDDRLVSARHLGEWWYERRRESFNKFKSFNLLTFMQVTFIQRSHAIQERKDSRSTCRAWLVRDTRRDQHGLRKKDENLTTCHAAGRFEQERGQVCEHFGEAGLEVGHESDVSEGRRSGKG